MESGVSEEMEVETKIEVKDEVNQSKHELPFRLTTDDLLLLVDFFYLPHQHGKRALQILNEFRWLKANSIKSDELSDTETAEKVRFDKLNFNKYSPNSLKRTRSVSILFQNHPQRYEKLVSY